MVDVVLEDLKDIDFITPVPMHKLKRIFRGYNPPQILAWELSKKLAKPFLPNLLIKKKITKHGNLSLEIEGNFKETCWS